MLLAKESWTLLEENFDIDVVFLSISRLPSAGGDAPAETTESSLTNSLISASLIFIHCTWFIVSLTQPISTGKSYSLNWLLAKNKQREE